MLSKEKSFANAGIRRVVQPEVLLKGESVLLLGKTSTEIPQGQNRR
jgi:hypothetical protein